MDYMTLTPAQKRVILHMLVDDYYLVNNEGKDYKVWLEDKSLTKRSTLNRTTAEVLSRQGWFTLAPIISRTNPNLIYNTLSERALKHLQFLTSIGKINPYF